MADAHEELARVRAVEELLEGCRGRGKPFDHMLAAAQLAPAYSPNGTKRLIRHDLDGGLLDPDGRCQECGAAVPVPEVRMEPGPGFQPQGTDDDPVSSAINTPRRLLEPIVTARTPARGRGRE
ncbi:hypothetical protein OG937_44255 [Streptomyces sp. NBC_00510]